MLKLLFSERADGQSLGPFINSYYTVPLILRPHAFLKLSCLTGHLCKCIAFSTKKQERIDITCATGKLRLVSTDVSRNIKSVHYQSSSSGKLSRNDGEV
jgi:hypothetical protein